MRSTALKDLSKYERSSSVAISACSGDLALALVSDSKPRSSTVETVTDRGSTASFSSRVIFSHPAMSSRLSEVEVEPEPRKLGRGVRARRHFLGLGAGVAGLLGSLRLFAAALLPVVLARPLLPASLAASLAPSFAPVAVVLAPPLPLPLPMFLALFSSVSAIRSQLDWTSQ